MITIDMNQKWVVYQITNLINRRYYRGKTAMRYWVIGYAGSSKPLKHAYIKHGKENFKREILATFDHEDEAYDYEEFIVKTYNEDNKSYNLTGGGFGGGSGKRSHLWGIPKSQEAKDKLRIKNSGENSPIFGKMCYYDNETKINRYFGKDDIIPKGYVKGFYCATPQKGVFSACYGKKMYYNPKTKKAMMFNIDEVPDGWILGSGGLTSLPKDKNPNFAKKWYYDPITGDDAMFRIDDEPEGWIKGRQRKWCNNPITGKNNMFNIHRIPEGWVIGRLNNNINRRKENMKYGKNADKHRRDTYAGC